ncbi:MAG: cell surface protein SprA [Calditrichia bacterium]
MTKRLRFLFYLPLLLWLVSSVLVPEAVNAQGLRFPATPNGVATLSDPSYEGLGRMASDSLIFYKPFQDFQRVIEFDSTNQYVIVEESLYDRAYRLPIKMDVDYYLKEQLQAERRRIFLQQLYRDNQITINSSSGGIELNIPGRIKSKAFKRIFGGDRVGLRVSGNITFEIAGRTESREGSAVTSIEQRNTFSPKFKQTQQFRVEGRVGDKVTISVDQNSEATFDFENTLKLTYEGDEDEIIQSIEAGNVGLSLPSTRFVSTTSNHQGLFGVKSEARVGNLSFTGIASLERGENETLNVSGSSRENTVRKKDYEFVRNKFYFIDSLYLDQFEDVSRQMIPNVLGSRRVRQLDVWKSVNATTNRLETVPGFAVLDANAPLDTTRSDENGRFEVARFQRLQEDEYSFDPDRGYFWLKGSNIQDEQVLAIAYSYGDPVAPTEVGTLFQNVDTTQSVLTLQLIRGQYSGPDYPTWNLEMKNVYDLGAISSPEGFDINIVYTEKGEDQTVDATGDSYNFILGLDRLNEQGGEIAGGDQKIDVENNPFVFDLNNGYLILPKLRPFDPGPTLNPNRNPDFTFNPDLYVDVYDVETQTEWLQRTKFEIEVTTKSVSNTFELGFNVLEGSEKVRLNGRELKRDTDYTIDYFSGQLQISAAEARRADAQIEIEYERGQLFQLDKKSLLGARLQYDFNPENFLGFTTLYYSKSTLDQRVRLGQEPLKNWVWDVNTSLSFKPNFISSILDKLPILETSAESKLKIEAEYAQVNPNPNTFNEESLGETDGVAYIDDFEGSKRFTTLGIQYQIWTPASVPGRFRVLRDPTINFGPEDFASRRDYADQLDAGRVGYYWYNPFNQVAIRSIWPNRDTNTQSGNTTNILVLSWQDVNSVPERDWGGMMRSTSSFSDQSKTKFIEIWLNGEGAQVNIDVGTISEDYFVKGSGFGTLNTEDKNFNGLLDLGEGSDFEDTGVDGVVGVDGTNVDGDAGNDDWAAPNSDNPSGSEFRFINGTENSSERQGARFPDTEDLDGDGTLNETNSYFTYSINLNDGMGGRNDPYFIEETVGDEGATGWKLFRIPLNDVRRLAVGDPDPTFQQVLNTRVWVNDFEEASGSIGVAALDFVGNEWEDVGFQKSEDTGFVIDENRFKVTVLNTDENERYFSPPGVEGIVDRVTRVESKEQALVFQINDFNRGARVEARKQLREKVSLLNYRNLRMFVHGEMENDLAMMQGDTLEFYLRFGVTDDIYYEYRQPIYSGWTDSAERNNVDIDFDILTSTKEEGDSIGVSDAGERIVVRKDPNYPQKEIVIVGSPGLHNIKYFTAGVRNKGTYINETEVWFDELRLTGVEREKGSAMRLSSDLTIADLGRISAQWELVDDDFRRVESQFSDASGQGLSDEKQSYNMNLNVDKFLPESWGLDIPVSGSLRRSRKVPKYFFNSDRRTNYELGSIGNRVNAFFGLAKTPEGLEEEVTTNESRSVGATIQRRRGQRDPWYLKYTVNQLVLDVDFANTQSSSPNVKLNETTKLSGSVKFGIPFGNKTYFKPFSWLGTDNFLKGLASQKLYYLPSKANVDITLNDQKSVNQNRIQVEARPATITVKTTRKFLLDYKMFESMNFTYNRNYQNDGRLDSQGGIVERRAGDVLSNIFSRFDFGEDRRVDQRFGANYNPKLLSWLTTNYRYQSDFIYSFDNPQLQARSSTSNISQNLRLDLKLSTLMNKIYSPKKGNRGRTSNARPRGGRRPANRGGDDEANKEKDDEAEGEKKEDGGRGIPNPGILLWHFFNSFKSFNLDFKKNDSYGNSNLRRIPRWQYQFGLSEDPNPTDTPFTGTSEDTLVLQPISIKNSRGVDGSLQLDLVRNLKTNFKYNYQTVDNQANDQVTQSIASSVFFTGDDPDANQQDWWQLIPDWRISLSGVEKFPFIKNFATSASIEHSRNGKFSENSRFDGEEKSTDNISYTINYQPFIGITINTKWGITGNIRSNRSVSFDYRAAGSTNKREQSGFSLNASYSVTRGFNLPLPFMKNKKLKNEIQFQLAFDQSKSSNFTRTATQSEFEELDVSDNWKLRPAITYRFSQRVNGTAFYEQSTATNKRTGDTSYKEFGINVNIAIR